MPTKEQYQKHKEYYKEYREKNKEHRKEYNKEWYKNNQEHKKEYKKEYNKQYLQTATAKKSGTISRWKQLGLICDNYEELYKHYINTFECDNCGVELVSGLYGNNKRCMDHCHITGKFRNILCNMCNIERGKDDNSNK